MKIDLCALTEDLLPLYAEDLLSPATHELVAQHAAQCPACQERLHGATAPLPTAPPPQPEGPLERPARLFFGRLRRLLANALIVALGLMIVAACLGYAIGRKSPWEKQRIPARVESAEEVAAQAIPGWKRAVVQGLVVDLGITERIPGTEATITLEKAWYSGRQAYILYTVTAPEGGYCLPTWAYLTWGDGEGGFADGGTDWSQLSTWGGFSREGFHSVLIFSELDVPEGIEELELTIRQWAPVTPKSGLQQGQSVGSRLVVPLPWDTEFGQEPEPVSVPWPAEHTWLGRTLILEELRVGIGRMELLGEIRLPEGERDPGLGATLLVGEQALDLKRYHAEPANEPGRYRFTATFDGPNRWPAPVRLELYGIGFATDQVLEWPIPWPKYRDLDGSSDQLMDPEDQVSVTFYDSELVSIRTTSNGVAIEQRDPDRKPPYVRASLKIGGRGIEPNLEPGFELVSPNGEVLTALGGGGGVIHDDPRTGQRHGVAAHWWEGLPEGFQDAEELILRYVHPRGVMVLQETWELPASE